MSNPVYKIEIRSEHTTNIIFKIRTHPKPNSKYPNPFY